MSNQPEVTLPFKKMTIAQKCVFFGKAAVCVLSFGFIYSHIFTEI